MSDNIELFDQACALVLATLYSSFPVTIFLKVEDLAGPAADGEDEQAYHRRLQVFTSTVEFLVDEGFVRVSSVAGKRHARVFSEAVLTSKGLAALRKVPAQLDASQKSIGAKLSEYVRDMGKHVTQTAVSEAIKQIIPQLFR